MTARRCDRCGAVVVDAVGDRQTSLFDVQADPRATPEALAELRAGRILCPACQRTPELPWADSGKPPHPGFMLDIDPRDVDGSVDRYFAALERHRRMVRSMSAAELYDATKGCGHHHPSIRVTAPPDPFPRPVVDYWTRKIEAHVDAAEMAEAVAGLE